MTDQDGKRLGSGTQGKGSGGGAMTDLPEGMLGDNDVLSNRDKAQHSKERGLDSKWVQSEQLREGGSEQEK